MPPAQVFWFAAGVLATLAVAFVIVPLATGRARAELWAGLPRWSLPAGLVLLGAALGLYLWLGSPQLVAADSNVAATPAAAPGHAAGAQGGQGAGSMESAVTSLERKLAQGGGADADWELLARSYEFLQRPADAALARQKKLPAGAGAASAAVVAPQPAAPALSAEGQKLKAAADAARLKRDFAAARASYDKLVARKEMNADTWADYADALASMAGGRLAGEPEALVRKALALDPDHPKALWLQASADEETGRYADAVASWQHLAGLLDPNGPDGKAVALKLAEDQKLAGVAGAGAVAAGKAPAGAAVEGEVVLADGLRGKVPAGLTLFIVAKSVASPGPPVAILRLSTGSWPVKFRLDDTQSMIPGRTLSGAGSVTIEARTSRSGQAMPQPGDFQGSLGPLDPKAGKPLRLVLDKVVG